MTNDRRTFVFNVAWAEVLSDYPAEVRLEVYDAIIRYAASGTLTELKPLSSMAFSFIKHEIDYNIAKYDNIVAQRSAAGRKGNAIRWGHSLKSQTSQKVANIASVANVADNDNVYDNDNVNDNDNNNVVIKRESVEKKRKPHFLPPSIEEVKVYVEQKGYRIGRQPIDTEVNAGETQGPCISDL